TASARPDGDYDVFVRTRDKWTLVVGAAAAYVGGVSRGNAEIGDTNLFGLGKELEVDFAAHAGFREAHANYVDPNILGTRLELVLDGSVSNLGTLFSGSF